LYEELKCCLILDRTHEQDINQIDYWFSGVIVFKIHPNKYVIWLIGEQGIGKTEFFRNFYPLKNGMAK